MNLTPIYELRSRLRTAMIAGTNLISEDFRLKRAAEDMKPMEALSPVFAKIGQMTETLLSDSCENKEGLLLDTITLVDALLCTQGQVAVTGEITPVTVDSWGSVITNAPYSVVKTLVEALTTSGNGHYQYVLDTHEEKPELFQDYRVKSAMVQALGAGYAELAEQVEVWLKEEGPGLVPMLQKGFDPKGKKEMVRRVQVMEAVAGAACNAFFVTMLPEAEKEVKNALIYALRHSEENVELLLELVKKEKGNAKKMAQYALACMSDTRAEQYFREMYEKKPAEALGFLSMTTTAWAARLVTESLRSLLERCKKPLYSKEENVHTEEETLLLGLALKTLPGKTGEFICEAFREAYEVEDIFYQPSGKKEILPWELSTARRIDPRTFKGSRMPEIVAARLKEAIQRNADVSLCALAEELYGTKNSHNKNAAYFSAVATAKLLGTEDCAEWLRSQLFPKSLLGTKKNSDLRHLLAEVLACLNYEEKAGGYCLKIKVWDEADEQKQCYVQPVPQDIAGAFTDILMEYSDSEVDEELMSFINPANKELCEKLGDYFYKKAKVVTDGRTYWKGLRRCGFETCEGLLTSYVSKNGGAKGIEAWQMYYSLRELPGTAAAIEGEAEALRQLVSAGKVQIRNWNEQYFTQYVDSVKENRQRV